MEVQRNWYVVTGGPSSGLSTILDALKAKGYLVEGEAAREVIDEARKQGLKTADVRGENGEFEASFQIQVLGRKLQRERFLELRGSSQKPVVWDRAVPDSIAYYENAGLDPGIVYMVSRPSLYRIVFFLELLPNYVRDYARTETPEQRAWLSQRLYETYCELGCRVVKIPVLPTEERVALIEQEMSQ